MNAPQAPQHTPGPQMYRGKCEDGLRCLHGCHVNERCHAPPLNAEQPRYELRVFDFAAGEDGGWMAWRDCSESEYLHYDGRRADVQVRIALATGA
jgi:hypothetical protein